MPCIISSIKGSNAKRYLKMTRTGRILSRGSQVCFKRWIQIPSAGIDLSAVIAAACHYLGIEVKKLVRRFNVDRSVISRANQRISRDPGTACSHQNFKKRTRTRKKSTLKQRPFHPTKHFLTGRNCSTIRSLSQRYWTDCCTIAWSSISRETATARKAK